MSQDRKKIERILPPKPEPKKRVNSVEQPKEIIVEVINDLVTENKKNRVKNPDKYVRFSFEEISKPNNTLIINRRVINGEIKYAYYAIDNEIGYHYYLIHKT